MSEPIDILAVAGDLKNRASEWVRAAMMMNSSSAAAASLDRARAELQVAQADYSAAEDLMMALRT